MLERAALRLENAGTRFICNPRNRIRAQRSFSTTRWTDIDTPSWYRDFLDTRSHPEPSVANADRAHLSSSSQGPSLDFLYPYPLVGTHAGSRQIHRRRKSFTRSYSTANTQREIALDDDPNILDPSLLGEHIPLEPRDNALRKLKGVLFGEKRSDYEKAWDLYEEAGSPRDMMSSLLAYLSSSNDLTELSRSIALFDSIDSSDRSEDDYYYLIKLLVEDDHNKELVEKLCREANMASKAAPCWSYALSFYVDRLDWQMALRIWSAKPKETSKKLSLKVRGDDFLLIKSLPDRIISALDSVEKGTLKLILGLGPLIKFLLFMTVSNRGVMKETTMERILAIFDKSRKLSMADPRYYFWAISTLRTVDEQTGMARSMVLYRNFRLTMSSVPPTELLILGLLNLLSKLQVSNGVHYLLDEYRRFYKIPSRHAYEYALKIFSNLGNVPEVEKLLEDYSKDHGKPKDQNILTPLLHAHATLGNVSATREHHKKLSTEYGMVPDVASWNVLLYAYIRNSDLVGAFSVIRQMREAGVNPDAFTFTMLLGLLAKREDMDATLKVFGDVKRYNIPVDVPLLRPVVLVLCSNGKYAAAEQLVDEVTRLEIPGSSSHLWNILLWKYAFQVDIDSMIRVQDRMINARATFDEMTYGALMLALTRTGNTGPAVTILERLHRSRRVHATEFHYAIILDGYVRENNRDMIHVIYDEICRRFEDPDPSSKLAMLKSKIQRDLQLYSEASGRQLGLELQLIHAEEFLDTIMEKLDVKVYAIRRPQPGTNRRPIKDAVPSIYYEQVMSAYGTHGSLDKVDELVQKFLKAHEDIHSGDKLSASQFPSLGLLRVLMMTHLKGNEFDYVEACWKAAFERTLRDARPMENDVQSSSESRSTPESGWPETDSADRVYAPVPPRHKYALSQCLSLYLRSLARQNLYRTMESVIGKLERASFALSTDNWSLYIKLLTLSDQPEDQLKAFDLFENLFIDKFPGWEAIRRGYALRPPDAPATLDLVEPRPRPRGKRSSLMGKTGRRVWAKSHPDYMQPTYSTMVHLSSAFLAFQVRSVSDGGAELTKLGEIAPSTCDVLSLMPFWREKYQGILLRGRTPRDDDQIPESIPQGRVFDSGVLEIGSGSRIDTSPTELFDPHKKAVVPPSLRQWVERDPNESSEPEREQIEKLIEEDAQWRGSVKSVLDNPYPSPDSHHILRQQDELDVESESMIDPKTVNTKEFEEQQKTRQTRSPFQSRRVPIRKKRSYPNQRSMMKSLYSLFPVD